MTNARNGATIRRSLRRRAPFPGPAHLKKDIETLHQMDPVDSRRRRWRGEILTQLDAGLREALSLRPSMRASDENQ